MTGRPGRAHHQGDYQRRAKLVRDNANRNTLAQCWRCGMTYAEYAAIHGAAAAKWTAGHVNDGEAGGELRAEHMRCNASAGAAHGNRLREPRSQRWY